MEEEIKKDSSLNIEKRKKSPFLMVSFSVFLSVLFGFFGGMISGLYFYSQIADYLKLERVNFPSIIEQKTTEEEEEENLSQEEAIIRVVKDSSPSVVSIVVTKDVPIIEGYSVGPFGIEFEQSNGTERREIGGGTGFIVSNDGFIVTNKHVVSDTDANYTVFTLDGKKFEAMVLDRDPLQDLAVLKIKQEEIVTAEKSELMPFPAIKIGDSKDLQIGQTVVAIGNALGEFRNTVSVGVISGLGRTVSASGGGTIEVLEDVIQTDAAINRGNSGGPLLNLKGEVIGINTAMALGAQSIGFAIPINGAKKAIEQVRTLGKIVYPFLGVRYVILNEDIQEENNFDVNYGALVLRGSKGEAAVFPNSPAQKSGILENDIILEFNNEKITTNNSLAKIILKYNPGESILLKVLRNGETIDVSVVLEERGDI
ncbi:MAG: trypsin-like peptidase domain-containing protein [Candidatus Paceibacterota bacterium]|nr:trypsin-like peptidase domain-containing protein [Candidatus Paceibacterota bacterium]MDD4466847.1 trypsin-like peptidase domain-containing protein [Candidatus Paceibacterota bacterium]MDD4897196.1 trypsin-like peptidase domain-containing protein [Candidatus Paceibacterota bacterium]